MGSAQSTADKAESLWNLDFTKVENFLLEWGIDDVTRAYNLYYYGLGATPPRRLTRKQFSTVFDATKFPELTMPTFEKFKRDEKDTIFALEPLVLLVLFCKGEHMDKYSFIFTTFDLNDDKVMSKDEITILIQCVMMSLKYYGIVKMEFLIADVMQMVDSTLAPADAEGAVQVSNAVFNAVDENGDGVLDMDEFASWCESNEWVKALISGFDAFRSALLIMCGADEAEVSESLPRSGSPASPRVKIVMPDQPAMIRTASAKDVKSSSFRAQGKDFRNTDSVMDTQFAQLGLAYNSHDEMAKAVSIIANKYRQHNAFTLVATMKKNKLNVQTELDQAKEGAEVAAKEVEKIESKIANPIMLSETDKADLKVELQTKKAEKEKMRRKSVALEKELHIHELAEQAQDEAIEAIANIEKISEQLTEVPIENSEQKPANDGVNDAAKGHKAAEAQSSTVRKASGDAIAAGNVGKIEEQVKAAEEKAQKTVDGLREIQHRAAATRRASQQAQLQEQIAEIGEEMEKKRKQSVMLEGYTGLEDRAEQVAQQAEDMQKKQADLEAELEKSRQEAEEAKRQRQLEDEETRRMQDPRAVELVRLQEYRELLHARSREVREKAVVDIETLGDDLDELDTELMFGYQDKYKVKCKMLQKRAQVKLERLAIKDADATLKIVTDVKDAFEKDEEAQKLLASKKAEFESASSDDGDRFYEMQDELALQEKEAKKWQGRKTELVVLLKAFKVSETMIAMRRQIDNLLEEKAAMFQQLSEVSAGENPNEDQVKQATDAFEQVASIIEVKQDTLRKMDSTRAEIQERVEKLDAHIKANDDEYEEADDEVFNLKTSDEFADKQRVKELRKRMEELAAETKELMIHEAPQAHVMKHLVPFYNRPAGRDVVKIAKMAPHRPRHKGVVADECAQFGALAAVRAAAEVMRMAEDALAAAAHVAWMYNDVCTVASRDVRQVQAAAQHRRRFQLQANASGFGADVPDFVAEARAAVEELGLGVDSTMPLPQRLISPRKSSSGQHQVHHKLRKPLHKVKKTYAADADDKALDGLDGELTEMHTHYVDIGDNTQVYFKLLKIFQRFDRKRDGSFALKDLTRMVDRGDRDLLDLLQIPERVIRAGFVKNPQLELMQIFDTEELEEWQGMQFAQFKECFDKYWKKIDRHKATLVIQSAFRRNKAVNIMYAEKSERFRLLTKLLHEKKKAEEQDAALRIQSRSRARKAQQEAGRRREARDAGERARMEAERLKREQQAAENARLLAELQKRREAQKKVLNAQEKAVRQRRNSINKIVDAKMLAHNLASVEQETEEEEMPNSDSNVDEHLQAESKHRFKRMPKRKMRTDMSDAAKQELQEARIERNEATIMLLAELRGSHVQPRFRTRPGKEPGQAKGAPDAGTSWLLHMKRHAKKSTTASVGGSVTELGTVLPTPPQDRHTLASQTPRARSHKQLAVSASRNKSLSPRSRMRANLRSAPTARRPMMTTGLPRKFLASTPFLLPADSQLAEQLQAGRRPSSARRTKPPRAPDAGPPQQQQQPLPDNNGSSEACSEDQTWPQPESQSQSQQRLVLPQIPVPHMRMMPSFGRLRQPYPTTPSLASIGQ